MKKIAVVLVLLFLASAIFADNARVLPALTGRLNVAPSYTFAMGGSDSLGNFERYDEASAKLFNLGFALEFGVIDWITAAVQWVPGLTLWSDISAAENNMSELFVGAKIQLLGPQAPFRSDEFRFAMTPGVQIPLMEDQALAAGARLDFDWIFNRNFFVSLYNETLFYPGEQEFSQTVPEFHDIDGDLNYDYRLTFGIESVYTIPIGGGIDFTVGLPMVYRFLPVPRHSIDATPHASLLFTSMPLPLEFKFQYGVPIWGRSSIARHTASLQVRMYFALGR